MLEEDAKRAARGRGRHSRQRSTVEETHARGGAVADAVHGEDGTLRHAARRRRCHGMTVMMLVDLEGGAQPHPSQLALQRNSAEGRGQHVRRPLGEPVFGPLGHARQRTRGRFSPSHLVVAFLGRGNPAAQGFCNVGCRGCDELDVGKLQAQSVQAGADRPLRKRNLQLAASQALFVDRGRELSVDENRGACVMPIPDAKNDQGNTLVDRRVVVNTRSRVLT